MIAVSITTPNRNSLTNRTQIRSIVRTILQGEGIDDAAISIAFVDDATSHRINKQFLDHDEATDVITFPLSDPNGDRLEGELVISLDYARSQAKERGHDASAELALYVIHGLLHLCGYDDKTKPARREMRRREAHYLDELSLPPIADKER